MSTFTRETEIRKLPIAIKNKLIDFLEQGNEWKSIMSIITKDSYNSEEKRLKYTAEQIRKIQDYGIKQGIFSSKIFLEEWESTGLNKRPNLEVLLNLCIQTQLFHLADYIAINLLQEPPPERPLIKDFKEEIIEEEITEIQDNLYNLDSSAKEENVSKTIPLNSEKFLLLSKMTLINDQSVLQTPLHYNQSTIEEFTENFKTELGNGGFGTVYLGKLPSDVYVAIKKLNLTEITPEHFQKELEILIKCRHPNLLPLLGYSYNGPFYYLIHQYIPNGSLEDSLKKKSSLSLLWFNRLTIAHGIIKALNYLHTAFETPYVHRDVKSANILLDRDLSAKLCDFEGLRVTSLNSDLYTQNILGTDAYMAPEAYAGDVSIKLDSYSFGIVLLELLTGLPAFDSDREECLLMDHLGNAKGEEISKFLDERARWSLKMAWTLYDLANKCLEDDKMDRLNSSEILKKFNIIEKNL